MAVYYYIFWISSGLLFFCYAGYGGILFIFNAITSLFRGTKSTSQKSALPDVTLIIAAYNEAAVLDSKIRNSLALNYPRGSLRILIVTDGSTDGSFELVSKYTGVDMLHEAMRKGKSAAIGRAMKEVRTPLVVFSDANTMLNPDCILAMVKHYDDPGIGAVAGEKKILSADQVSAVGQAEGLYWQYESFLKKQDAVFYTVIGASGELFSIRTELFPGIEDDIILDDFVISMRICMGGHRIAYEPGAYATEAPSLTLREEGKRKVRIATGAYQAAQILHVCSRLFIQPRLVFQYFTRRLLRWYASPLLLLTFGSSLVLAFSAHDQLFMIFFWVQSVFYAAAIPGWMLVRAGKKAGLLTIPFYFVFMNYCLLKGFFRYLGGKYSVLWEKSLRQAVE